MLPQGVLDPDSVSRVAAEIKAAECAAAAATSNSEAAAAAATSQPDLAATLMNQHEVKSEARKGLNQVKMGALMK